MVETNAPILTEALTDLLANTYRLMFKSQAFHWNATGPLFAPLHLATERQYTEMFAAIDEMAERVRALRQAAPSSLDEILMRSTVRDRLDTPDAAEMVRELVADHGAIAQQAEALAQAAAAQGDSATADLAVRRRSIHEKEAWLLEAMIG